MNSKGTKRPREVAVAEGEPGEHGGGGVSGFREKKKGNSSKAWLPSAAPREDPAAPLHRQPGDLDAIRQFINKTSEQFPLLLSVR